MGDQVNATFVEEGAVFLSRDQAPPSLAERTAVALAPKGAKPGIVMADTFEVAATVPKVDIAQREASLGLVDGTNKTVKIGKSLDLTKVSPGDDVTGDTPYRSFGAYVAEDTVTPRTLRAVRATGHRLVCSAMRTASSFQSEGRR